MQTSLLLCLLLAGAALACDPGTYNNGSTCVDCAKGKYSATTNATACTNCSAGSFAPSTGAEECELCPALYYQAEQGASTCDSCPLNLDSELGSTSCRSVDEIIDLITYYGLRVGIPVASVCILFCLYHIGKDFYDCYVCCCKGKCCGKKRTYASVDEEADVVPQDRVRGERRQGAYYK